MSKEKSRTKYTCDFCNDIKFTDSDYWVPEGWVCVDVTTNHTNMINGIKWKLHLCYECTPVEYWANGRKSFMQHMINRFKELK